MGTLLERDAELEALGRVLTGLDDGGGCLVLLGGEAGVGKTSLVRELRDRAGGSPALLVGACEPRPFRCRWSRCGSWPRRRAGGGSGMSTEPLRFLGTVARMKLTGTQTGGRFAGRLAAALPPAGRSSSSRAR